MLWIIIYIVLVNIGDIVSESIGIDSLATAALLVGLTLVLISYVRRNQWSVYYGLTGISSQAARKSLFFVPLVLITAGHYLRGIKPALTVQDVAIIFVLMICVGFIEELLFRGLLFRAIERQSGVNRAILISGVTFGIGHIVNLARGMAVADQMIQIVAGIFIGIALAYLFVVTRSILPGAIFHVLFNISGNLANDNVALETQFLLMIIVVMVAYTFYLRQGTHTDQIGSSERDHQTRYVG